MRKIIKFLIHNSAPLIVFILLVLPTISSATGLVPCNNTPAMNGDKVVLNTDGSIKYDKICDFNALMALVNNILNFILKDMVIPIAAIMMAYAGFLLVTAGGEAASARTKAKTIFKNAVFGLIIAMAAWLIVKLILTTLNYKGPGIV